MKIFKRGASDTMLRISTVDVSDHHVGIYILRAVRFHIRVSISPINRYVFEV